MNSAQWNIINASDGFLLALLHQRNFVIVLDLKDGAAFRHRTYLRRLDPIVWRVWYDALRQPCHHLVLQDQPFPSADLLFCGILQDFSYQLIRHWHIEPLLSALLADELPAQGLRVWELHVPVMPTCRFFLLGE